MFLETVETSRIIAILDEWHVVYPKMGILALLPEAEKGFVPDLQQLFNRKVIPLTGAVFPGLIAENRFQNRGILLMRFNEMPFSSIFVELAADEKNRKTLDKMTNSIKDHISDARDKTLFMIFDSMVPNIATILDNLYLKLADAVHYMGANAGSETFQPMPCLFDNKEVVQNGVLILLMDHHSGAILDNSYSAPKHMISATSTEGNRITSIDWGPAFEVYREVAKTQYGVSVTRENFYQYSVCFPFGIIRADGEILVRIPVALEEDGSLFCVGEVPSNSLLTLLKAPEVDSPHTVEILTGGLKELHGTIAGKDVATFYCAGRKLYLGTEKSEKELLELSRRIGSEIFGALSLGEIGSSKLGGYPLFHNAALVSCKWG